MEGYLIYLIGFLTMAGIYAISVLGLNINWGFTGLFNVGIAGFFAVGAYASAILTTASNDGHFGGFDLPIPVGWLAAMLFAAAMAWVVGKICLRLRSDYLAIATIGIAEILRLTFKNWESFSGGTYGIGKIPRPFAVEDRVVTDLAYMFIVFAIVAVIYIFLQRGLASPWGRVMRAIRENEVAAAAAGKDVERFRLQAFVLGSALMGLGGAMLAHYIKFLSYEATEPIDVTFLPWVMLIVGGSGNNKGAILGALLIWFLWTMTNFITNFLPDTCLAGSALEIDRCNLRASYMRVFLIGLLLQIVLQRFPRGLLPEKAPVIHKREAEG
jgi:branched-chain amino acid transport system permease protein